MDFSSQSEAQHSIRRIEEILKSDIFLPQNSRHPLRESAFIELMICLRDLMKKAEDHATRISFKDDINTDKDTKDVTDTIRHVRDAICHLNSGKRHVDQNQNKVSFCSMAGKGCMMKIGDIELKSDYDDEVCFFYGKHRLYLKRHIIRAFSEASQLIKPFLG